MRHALDRPAGRLELSCPRWRTLKNLATVQPCRDTPDRSRYQRIEYTSHNSGAVNCTAGHTLSSVAHDTLQSSQHAAPSAFDRLALPRRRRLSKHVRDASKSTLGAYLV